ncbi:hypothetical protein TURU_168391 [Turdus rufiventris]|nr:hypothetical protein TURU_168391 [Turdus rufiventris]
MAGEEDRRKRFISATAANYFGLDPAGGAAALAAGLHSRAELSRFLDDGNEFLLVVRHSGAQLSASNKIEATDSENNVLVFFKLRPDVITEDNLHSNILVSSMLDSPINTLYQAVRQVFAPVLLKDEKWSKAFDPKLQKLLSELEAGLSTALRSAPSYTGTKVSEDDVRAILTPTDEFQFWRECAHHGNKGCSKERASYFRDLFEDIAKDYYNLDTLSLFEVVDLVEATKDTVDSVWRQTEHDPYPQSRMHNLLDVIGGSLGRFVQRKLAALNLWEDTFHSVKENIQAGILVCEQWVSACEYLTGQLWQRYTLHPWKNEKYFPELLAKLGQRLDEVLTVRTLHEKLMFFLPSGEQNSLHLSNVFEPFAGLNPVHYNPYTEPLWKAAVSQYERIIAPAEQKIASKLKKVISEILDSPQQLLQIFQKHKELIKHPNISKELLFERETLLAALQDYVKDYETDFETRCHGVPGDVSGPLSGKNLSEVVNNIVWVQQLELKVDDSVKLAEALLSDLPGFQTFHQSANCFLEQLKVYEQEQFDDWSRNIQSELSNPKSGLCIQANSPVMELDPISGALNILYSDRLVTLLREVRQLSALGFAIPAKIQHVANTAQKFCKQAVILKQVAHFYNSIDQQMIGSQKPMMLQSALAFEQIIKHSKSRPGGKAQITWDNPKELEAYIQKLQAAAERLSTENRKLRKWHTNFIQKVISLMNIDLLRQQQRWKEGLQELRTGFASLESQAGQGRLQFRPPFEEVRARYYREMKRFISIPNQFRGEWVVIGQVDMEPLVKTHLSSKQDWEKNFKALKVRGKEAERLPSTIRIDCFTVNCNPVKTAIDDFIQKLYDILVVSLRKSIQAHLCDVSTFLTDAMETLVIRPQTVEEIAEDNLKYLSLNERKEGIFLLFHEAEDKNKLLRTVAGAGLDSISNLRATWDKFELMMESHQLMIAEQVEMMKGNVLSRINIYLQDLEKFKARWDQLKPSDDVIETGGQDVLEKSAQLIKEKKIEFDELKTVKEKLIEECHHFKLEEPDLSLSEAVSQDIQSCAEIWALYEEFYQGFQEKAKEDWITFRSKIYLFEEFLFNWHDRLRKMEEHTVMTVKLQKEVDKYKDLNCRAQGEITIREALRELELWGVGAVFMLTDYEDSQGKTIRLIKDWKDTVNQVGDHRCLLQSLKDSPYYKGFEDKVSVWEKKLADLDEYLQNLNQIQRKWVYLEPIFGRGALPKEQARFNRVDENFRSIMSDIKSDNRITSLNARAGIKNTLTTILDQLQRCQKSLNEFLEEKRSAFPRFYFVGDDDLLEILGQSTNPLVIQSHLKKLFAGINSVSFDDEFKYITAMKSVEGESVPLRNKVLLSDDVEVWLNSLALEMKETLKKMLIDCVDAGKKSQGSIDPSLFPCQILSLAEQILFTEDVESAIKNHNLQQLESELTAKLDRYTSVGSAIEDTGSTESGILELKLKALILDIIHNIDVVKQLNQAEVRSVEDWSWKKQLRFYMNDQKCYVQMVDAELQYTYEYQGIAPKLVYTPLTDKCYLTLTQAMKMGLGGNPYGPAGTGKTESVKALGGILGRQVLVFNCDEGIDVKSMGRIFVGLVKCGAWGCFDEFNRLEEAVLSAVSMQVQTIQHALKKHSPVCEMLGKKVEMDPNSGIFITLNPAGKGYGGRQKLPDNLKQLFRPVAMTHPDNELIAEVILYSEGFKDAKILGRKLVAIFNLARELLTPQQHYDWGLRALKTVLRGCGSLLHQLKKSDAKQEINESHIVVQALRLNTTSKLTFADCTRFDELVKDVFPGTDSKDVEYAELTAALQQVFEEANLEIISTQIKKALELYEQLCQRMGVVIVGPSGGGKSTLWRMLKTALGKTGKVVKQYTMNPKAMPRHQLLGRIDMDTREWSDGVLTNSARQVVREPRDVTSWIICDGDIDPEWIESLNSVLDDNKLLTMPSGERIQFGSNVNFIFETHDLSCASPATISRMGMIFLSDEDTDLNALIKSWIRSQPEECRSKLENWIGDYFEKALNWVVKKNDFVVETSLVGTVMNGLSHLHGSTNRGQFIINLLRGLGGNLNMKSRQEFAKEVLTYQGFYDENLEWVGLENIQIVASMSAGGTLGRHKLTTRFTSIVRLCAIDYPEREQLQIIYSAYLESVLQKNLKNHPVWGSLGKIHQLAGSMVQIYEQVRAKFTVDDHSHYLFTPCILTQWVLGLFRYDLEGGSLIQTPDFVLEVLAYEACRLFRDRIVGMKELQVFDNILSKVFQGDWGSDVLDNMADAFYVTWGACQEAFIRPGQALPAHGRPLGRLNSTDLKDVIQKGIIHYGRDKKEIDILLFHEVLSSMSKVDRVLSFPGGSLLLAGRSGVGRRTVTSLVSHMHGAVLITPKISRGYQLKQFKSDLKYVMELAGIEAQQVVLLLEDYQFVHSTFLEMVNSLLSSGEVPGLYKTEELEPLLSPLKDQASQDGFTGPIFNYFTYRIQQNLHVVLIMDSTNSNFTINCESNPALYKKCQVLWMETWSEDSMKKIPEMLLCDSDEQEKTGKTHKEVKKKHSGESDFLKSFLAIHESCKIYGATPSRYMTFLHVYSTINNSKRRELIKRQNHLQAGVSKLNEAKALVDELNKKAEEQSILLKMKQDEADAALQEITVSMQNASEQKAEMEKIKHRIAEEAAEIEQRKKKIEDELKEVQPLVNEAKLAVGNIKPEALLEIRSLRMPPDIIRDILEGVLRLMGIFDTSWVSMKSFLAKRSVREDIGSFDARNIPKEIRESVEELLSKNRASFDPKNAKRASAAAAPLAAWVNANIQYSHVLERIQPLEKEKAGLEANLKKTEDRKQRLEDLLNSVGQKVLELKDKFQNRTTEAAKLEAELSKAQKTLKAAEVSEITDDLATLPKRAQLAAAFITYLSAAPEDQRKNSLDEWTKSAGLEKFDLRRFLCTESEELVWKSEGLPSDDLSIENALVILQDTNFLTSLELAVRFGKTLIIQEMDGVEPVLYPLLRKDLIAQGPRYAVQIGEKMIDYNEEFRLFLSTRNPNPFIPPDASSIVTEVNFTTTASGLRGQLLALTIQHEKPDLEEQKTKLLQQEEDKKIQLAKLEDSLLETLATSQGNILENKDLIESLNQTKASSALIQESLAESFRLQSFLDKERDAYLPLAESASKMYFIISDLSKINNMYRFSLAAFLRLFQRALQSEQDSGNTEERIKLLIGSLKDTVYEYVCRCLFKVSLPDLYQTLCFEDEGLWRTFSQSSICEQDFPSPVVKRISLFQQVLVVQAVRPDRLQSAMALFACKTLVIIIGIKELSPPPLNMKRLYKETLEIEPILIIISPGADPSQELQELASIERNTECYHQIAMGQGQADLAIQTLRECAQNGEWLCLKNLHLVTSWLPVLEKGWTKFYEFSLSDLRAGFDIIDRLFEGSKDFQWEFVHGLFENAIYGGRVDNYFDMRVLRSYLEQLFNSRVIGSLNARGKKMSTFPCSISLPNSCSILDYRNIIESLPEDDKPDFFGLPANIARSSQRIISSQVISQLRILSRSVTAGCKFDREIWSAELSPILNLWKKLNQNSNLIHQKVSPPAEQQGSPILSFITLEQFNAIRLVQSVHQSLASLSKVIRGTSLLSSEVQRLASALLNQKNWVEKAEKEKLLSDTLDLSELFHPDTFLNALRQETARVMRCSVDSLKFTASWKGRIQEGKLQVKISGLQLEGCRFDGNRLSENLHDSPSVSSVLPCYMAWIPQVCSFISALEFFPDEKLPWEPICLGGHPAPSQLMPQSVRLHNLAPSPGSAFRILKLLTTELTK